MILIRLLFIALLCTLATGCSKKQLLKMINPLDPLIPIAQQGQAEVQQAQQQVIQIQQDAQVRYGELRQASRIEIDRLRQDTQSRYQAMGRAHAGIELMQSLETRLANQSQASQNDIVFRIQVSKLDEKAEAQFIQEVAKMAEQSGATVRVQQVIDKKPRQQPGQPDQPDQPDLPGKTTCYEFIVTPKVR
ncbi:MAG: hypothetical protein FWD53_10530 [Phycisphaerales bacterium]|nr:hypothetical protein [Phycisphaerales bacterium]